MEEILKDYPVVIEIPIAWGEMDAFQHVNNIVYFRYFESARIAYIQKIGYMKYMEKTGYGPILAETSCKYKFPLTFPDTISAGVKLSGMEEDHFIVNHVIVSHRHKRIAAEGQAKIVSYNYREKKRVPIPEELKQRFLALESD